MGASAVTVDDLERMPDDGRRYELVDGRLDVSPAPKPGHARVEHRLACHLESVCPPGFKVFRGAGIDLNARRTHHRIPDLSVFADHKLPASGYFEDPPVLAVEVVSPESRFRDHHTKLREYAAFGIGSYWIVTPDPVTPGITEFRLDGGEYRGVADALNFDVLSTDVPFPVRVVPHWLTADDATWKQRVGGG
ncbi:Uma2 family endonuclease [Streptomonospora sp. S1-112]|uniref:Uma2 family endonuclease n=1 Tax=Streptomonospora mangrovi TaxID=2883123 RepID=A0A9X3NS36_9ACTN|nr:Uma2 family endonuclease [Streptomonospora mangrovi]MDA0565760.1 Uma2 family endonuclease [Streptomonospora mangrovi]